MAPPPARRPSLATAVTVVLLAVALSTCPTHDSFESHLANAKKHPANLLRGITQFADRLRISVGSETQSYIFCRAGWAPSGALFLGLFGSWVWIPRLPASPRLWTAGWSGVCSSEGGAPMAFAALLVGAFVVATFAPRFTHRHLACCSLASLASGRLHLAVTSNLIHFSPFHLLHSLIQVLNFGPLVQAAIGCERTLGLLVTAALASSTASVSWHGLLRGRRHEGSVGASGVAIGLVAANAALFPATRVQLYGITLSAAQHLLLSIVLDALAASGGGARRGGDAIDVSAHVGGAAAGWALAKRWAPRFWS